MSAAASRVEGVATGSGDSDQGPSDPTTTPPVTGFSRLPSSTGAAGCGLRVLVERVAAGLADRVALGVEDAASDVVGVGSGVGVADPHPTAMRHVGRGGDGGDEVGLGSAEAVGDGFGEAVGAASAVPGETASPRSGLSATTPAAESSTRRRRGVDGTSTSVVAGRGPWGA